MSAKANLGHGLFTATLTRGPRAGKTAYYGRVWVKSEARVRYFALKATTEREARKQLGALALDPEKAMRERAARAVKVPTCGELFDRFLAGYTSRGGSRYYHNILKAPRAYFGDKPVTELTAQGLDAFLRYRRSLKTKGVPRKVEGKRIMVGAGKRLVGESTLRKACIALGTVCRWGTRRGIFTSNPLSNIEKPHEPGDRVTRALTPDEESAVLALLPALQRDVVEFAIYSGMRRGEILALTWPSIDRPRGVVHVIGTKTGKARVLPLSLSHRLPAILDRHPRRIGTDLLFHDAEGKALDLDRMNGTIEAAMKSAGVPKTRGVLWNVFRKTWSSRLYASGKVLPQDEAAWGGHGIAVAMKHYVEYSPTAQERAKGALDVVLTVTQTDPRSAATA